MWYLKLTIVTFHFHYPLQSSTSRRHIFISNCQWLTPLSLSSLRVSSSSVLPFQLWIFSSILISATANCSGLFCSHNHRNRFHLSFFQDVLTSATFRLAHTHCPSHLFMVFSTLAFHLSLKLAMIHILEALPLSSDYENHSAK